MFLKILAIFRLCAIMKKRTNVRIGDSAFVWKIPCIYEWHEEMADAGAVNPVSVVPGVED